MANRKVLLLSGSEFPNPIGQLRIPGWDVLVAGDMTAAGGLLARNDCRVGLVPLDLANEQALCKVEEFIQANCCMKWVALVQEAVSPAGVCKFDMESFYDYHTLPVDVERLGVTLGHAYGKALLTSRCVGHPETLGRYEMVGVSPAMRELYRSLGKIRNIDATVLVSGESGTGKELAARALHRLSTRAQAPFVAVNCGALPTHLIQTELFGHEKGAFTGAHQRKIGRIESATGGTIFLDEIGDLPLELQVNLLHFMQDRTIERVGSSKEIPLDVRVIAATHVDLEKAVAAGRFREDLYYRLNVLQLKVPPLREREGDVELLTQAYFDRFSVEHKSKAKGFTKQAQHIMNAYEWPGNVRELVNRTRRAMVMTENRLLTATDLGLDRRSATPRNAMTLGDARAAAEKELIWRVMRHNSSNVAETARQLGVSRVTLYRLINKYHME